MAGSESVLAGLDRWILIGLALGAAFRGARGALWVAVAEASLATAAMASGLVLLDHLYSLNPVKPHATHQGVHWAVAVTCLAASATLLFLGRDRGAMARLAGGSPGGRFLRLALPPIVALPPALGFVGLTASLAGVSDQPLVTALAVTVFIGLAGSTAWLMARAIDRMDAERREAERAVSRARAEEQRLQLESLQKLDALKDQFLSILMHELRTPLNSITGYGTLLQDETHGPLEPAQREFLERLLAGATALQHLVDDLLDMGQIQAGRFKVSPEPTSLAEVALDVLAALTPLAEGRGVTLENRIPPDSPDVLADRMRAGQILANLVGNALKFTPDGGRIEVRADRTGSGELRCEVFDDGPAIPAEARSRVFERFAQLDMSSTRRVSGVGLGLSICKAIVEAHGGRIGVADGDGPIGTTLWFTLPLAGEIAPLPAPDVRAIPG